MKKKGSKFVRLNNELRCDDEMPRVSVVYNRRKNASDVNPGTVEVMVYEPRVRARKYISTGVRVCVQNWSDVYGVVGLHDAAQMNAAICEQVNACVDALKVCPSIDQDMKVDRSDASFLDWLERSITASKMADGTKKHHWVMFRDLREFGVIRRFEDVKTDNIRAWLKRLDGTGISQVTLHGYWKRLRKWLNVAIVERRLPMDCFLGVKVQRGMSKERVFLTDDEIERLRSAKFLSLHLSMVRDRFLIQCGTGLAYEDLMTFDFTRHQVMGEYETLQGRRVKTGEQFFVVMLPMAVDVLKRYEWKVPAISNVKYNEYLGDLCREVGIDKKVTSHVGRHTYACYCLRHGVRMEAVQRALGHSDLKTTQIYAKLVDQDVVAAFSNMR